MITLAAASQKGGVAKTTTNLAIGGKLAADGARVLYIDLDPQMNLSTTLKAATSGVASSLDVLTGDATIAEAAQGIGSYHVVPASRLNGKADDLMSSVGKDYRLRKALSTVADDYDFVPEDTEGRQAYIYDITNDRAFTLPGDAETIGRESKNDIVIPDINVSRVHAEIRQDESGAWILTDLGSTNGTFVNGRQIKSTALQDADRIIVGTTNLEFQLI